MCGRGRGDRDHLSQLAEQQFVSYMSKNAYCQYRARGVSYLLNNFFGNSWIGNIILLDLNAGCSRKEEK